MFGPSSSFERFPAAKLFRKSAAVNIIILWPAQMKPLFAGHGRIHHCPCVCPNIFVVRRRIPWRRREGQLNAEPGSWPGLFPFSFFAGPLSCHYDCDDDEQKETARAFKWPPSAGSDISSIADSDSTLFSYLFTSIVVPLFSLL